MGLIAKVRDACLKRGANGILGIRRQFKIMDDNLDRKLDLEEFKMGLTEYGLELEPEEVEELFKEIDKDGTGTLHFEEFLQALRPPMSEERIAAVRKAFEIMDKTGDGMVTIEDLRGVYNAAHHPKVKSGEITEDEAFNEFLKAMDTPNDPDGLLTWGDFLAYYSGVSASIDTDEYFVEMMKSAWKMEDED